MEGPSQRQLFDKTFLDIVTYLESFSEVSSVTLQAENPILAHESVVWQKRNDLKLPADLKSFYDTFNGFTLEWKVEIAGKHVPIGQMNINRFNSLLPVTIDADPVYTVSSGQKAPLNPLSCRAFMLDSTCEVGIICIVFRSNNSSSEAHQNSSSSTDQEDVEVWINDNAGKWHFICQSFTQYIRLLLVHLGIFGWQLAYTPQGLSTLTQQWMNMFAKERLLCDMHH